MDTFDRLRHFEVLSHFDWEQLEILVRHTSPITYAPGSKVMGEGEDSRDFYLVEQGKLRIERTTP